MMQAASSAERGVPMPDQNPEQIAQIVMTLFPSIARKFFTLESNDLAIELPLAQMRMCGVLSRGPKTMSALSKELGVTLSATTQLTDRLEKAGMVKRVCECNDHRVKQLQLTELGQELIQKRNTKRLERTTQLFEKMNTQERDTVLSALQILSDVLNKQNDDTETDDSVFHGELSNVS